MNLRRYFGPFLGYRYPFGPRSTVGRIDQGQDFGGTGSILAIGNAKVIQTGAPGWPGGAGVLYRLLDGPEAGRYVYVYEGIKPSVRAGELVRAGQVIGHLIPHSSTGVEIGWANSKGVPTSHAEYTEGKETRAGKAFAGFLAELKRTEKYESHLGQHAKEEAGNSGVPGLEQVESAEGKLEAHGLGGLAGEILSGLVGDLAKSAEPLMLNIGLIGGGAFLVYYGISLMAGVKEPSLKLAHAGLGSAAVAE